MTGLTELQQSSVALEEPPRFLVIQNGARHNYSVPEAFQRAGAFSALYTDLTATNGLGAFFAMLGGSRTKISGQLKRRTPPVEMVSHVHTSDAAFLMREIARRLPLKDAGKEGGIRLAKKISEWTMLRSGTGDATHIYTMLGEGGAFIRRAKKNGLRVVGDVYIALSADAIVAEESSYFPDWSDNKLLPEPKASARQINHILLEQSDLLVCPSEFVRDDLVDCHGVDASRTCVIPYAVSPIWLSLDTSPCRGRVLFAGSANIRKGVHYLAMAATALKGSCKFVVAGGVSEKVRNHSAAKDLIFLGHRSRADMANEFARADVFAFPSLAEGSAGVTAEALGAGVPVVTTKAAGSIVRDGVDGLIVPERDPVALAEAVRSIVEDRDKREAMSKAARQRAQQFTWDGFARDVILATQQISK